MTGQELPERPRLRSGVRIFEDARGVIVRSSEAAFRIHEPHRDAVLRLLPRLDGTRAFDALLGGEAPVDAFYALRLLDSFTQSAFLADGPRDPEAPSADRARTTPRLDGVAIAMADAGLFSGALARCLRALGALVRRTPEPRRGEILLVCLDGPDIATLRQTNDRLLEAGTPWLPVYPFGDAVAVGPRIRPGRAACFRCFELRWLGNSPTIEFERAYLEHLAAGGFREEAPATNERAEQLAELVVDVLARQLSLPEPFDVPVALVRLEEGTTTEGIVLRHPLCDACRRTDTAFVPVALTREDWFEAPLPLPELARSIQSLVTGPCGLAKLYPPPPRPPETLLRQIALCRFALPEPYDAFGTQDNWAHGSATNVEDARALARIESIERYAGLFPSGTGAGLTASYESVADRALLPTELPLFSQAQYARPGFPFQPFDPSRPVSWAHGYDLTHDRPILVPSSAAWYGRDDSLLGECSSGVGAHSGRGHALLNGALELCERDAFMLHWLQRLSPPLFDLSTLPGEHERAMLKQVEQRGYDVRIADLTTDLGIPVCLALAFRGDSKASALLLGAGAALDGSRAFARAVTELYSALVSITDLWVLKPPREARDVVTLEDHARAYEHPDWLVHAEFLWASSQRRPCPPPAPTGDGKTELTQLTDALKEHGHTLIGVDLTPEDVARTRLRVVRAIVPGLVPLALGPGPRLGGRRVYEAPARMGVETFATREEDLNQTPHCFP